MEQDKDKGQKFEIVLVNIQFCFLPTLQAKKLSEIKFTWVSKKEAWLATEKQVWIYTTV